MAVMNKECFPELPQFLASIESSWVQQNNFIVKDVEQGYKDMILTLQKLPSKLRNCDGYSSDMDVLEEYLSKYDVDTQEYNDEMFKYLQEHQKSIDLGFSQAMHGFSQPNWTEFGIGMGHMIQWAIWKSLYLLFLLGKVYITLALIDWYFKDLSWKRNSLQDFTKYNK